MPITVTRNGLNVQEAEKRLQELLVEMATTNDPALEAEALTLYEQLSNFSPDCPACIAGRRLFVSSLADIKSGNVLEGLAKMKGSMKSVALKWATMRDKLSL